MLLARGPIWKHRQPNQNVNTWINIKKKILLQKSLPNSSRAWLLVRRPLSCLNSVSGVCYSCAGQMGQLISGQLRRWDFDFQTTYWLSSSPSICVWKKNMYAADNSKGVSQMNMLIQTVGCEMSRICPRVISVCLFPHLHLICFLYAGQEGEMMWWGELTS